MANNADCFPYNGKGELIKHNSDYQLDEKIKLLSDFQKLCEKLIPLMEKASILGYKAYEYRSNDLIYTLNIGIIKNE